MHQVPEGTRMLGKKISPVPGSFPDRQCRDTRERSHSSSQQPTAKGCSRKTTLHASPQIFPQTLGLQDREESPWGTGSESTSMAGILDMCFLRGECSSYAIPFSAGLSTVREATTSLPFPDNHLALAITHLCSQGQPCQYRKMTQTWGFQN